MTATQHSPAEPNILVIFGISGDLSQRYLLPALYQLIKDGLLHQSTQIVGISRRELAVDELLNKLRERVQATEKNCDEAVLEQMRSRMRMLKMDPEVSSDYEHLGATLDTIEAEQQQCMHRIYYLSIPPKVYKPIVKLLGENKLNQTCQHGNAKVRLLVEKPFGYDATSAQELIDEVGAVFSESQLFRIDHYLAKETVQNILTFRFENPIFESIWDNQHIDSVEIFASEILGIENRAHFYDDVGALRDFIQSHLIQLLAIIAMDRPENLDSEAIHANKQHVLQQVVALSEQEAAQQSVRGQYEGYPAEVNKSESQTETFAAIRIAVDNERWNGVPFVLWTGKALGDKSTEIVINFRTKKGEVANRLRFRLQPNEGIQIDLRTKKPGYEAELQEVAMDFSYQQNFDNPNHPNAYERVLMDATRGDHTLFATSDEVLQAWRIVQPVLNAWASNQTPLTIYSPGTKGSELVKPITGNLVN